MSTEEFTRRKVAELAPALSARKHRKMVARLIDEGSRINNRSSTGKLRGMFSIGARAMLRVP